ncbi:MAG: response regulator transcription factor [Actinomycetota bacterium]|nr:response regulator transcription factor [Actinomycetota bacterium]
MRVLICDDHPVFRGGLRLLLGELGVEVVGEAATGEGAVSAATELVPDVVVMDLHLPGMSGIEATRAIRTAQPGVGVLVLTMLDDDTTLLAALRAGANGYLLKGAGHADVERALAAVANGDMMVAADVAQRLRAGLEGAHATTPFPQLSRREQEVLELLARGHPNEQIAGALFLSVKTVRNNVSAILTKLGVDNRAAAVALARDAGLGRPLRGNT